MPDLRQIYATQAEQYAQMVACEDYQGRLIPALEQIAPLKGTHVVESGAGTGRVTRLLAPQVASIRAFDAQPAMLRLARRTPQPHIHFAAADHRALPVPSGSADVVVAGWSLSAVVVWNLDRWQAELEQALGEFRRVLRPGGTVILIETLGTGQESPNPPPVLRDYYAYLDGHGFASTWIRTDYRFDSLAEAEKMARFFFGDALAEETVRRRWQVLPECTGLWWWHKPKR